MDWTSKTHFQWDWETLALFNGEETEIAKPVEEPKLKIESGIDFCTGSAYSTGMVVFSSSEVADCSFKTSISAPVGSSSEEVKITPETNFKSFEGYPNNQNKYRNLVGVDCSENSTSVICVEGAKEPVIGLKLGRRTYFEDPCVGSNPKSSSSSPTISSNTLVKKSRVYQQRMLSTYCQVEGCNVDLTTAKDYHRKHRVCESHSKSPRVVVAGQERRFCQQCSRFHPLSEFDQKKRSCRRRLYDHNARRRKPQLETFSFNSSKLPPSYYDVKQQHANLEFDQAPVSQMPARASSTWDGPGNFKLTQTDSSGMKPSKIEGIDGQLHFPSNGHSDSISTVCYGMGKPLPLNLKSSTAAEVHNQGLEATVAFNMDGAQDLRRVLSLLSTDSHTPPPNLEPPSNLQFAHANDAGAAHPSMPSSHATMGLWQVEQQQQPLPQVLLLPFHSRSTGGSLHESSPLLRAATYGTGFDDSGRLS